MKLESKLKILYISAFAPCRRTAGQNYSRLLLEDLADKYKIDLIYWSHANTKIELSDKIRILKKFQVASIWTFLKRPIYFPLFSRRFSNEASELIQSIASNYDIIYFDFSQVMIYSLYVNHPFKVGMSHDVIAQKFSRSNQYRLLIPWIRYSENKILKSLNRIFTFSDKDSEFILNTYGLHAGVVSFYIEQSISDMDFENLVVQDYFILYGAWGRSENQDTINWLLNQHVTSHIKIIGGGMPQKLLSKIALNHNIEYLGFVDNPYPIIASSKGLIAPLWQGAGVKVKVIESLALGTPVIGTDVTFEGIDNICIEGFDACIKSQSALSFQSILNNLSTNVSLELKNNIRNAFFKKYGTNKFVNISFKISNVDIQ